MKNQSNRKPGRPAIPTATQQFSTFEDKFNSVRFDKDANATDTMLSSIYLNRAGLKAMGVPEGHVPTVVEVTVRALKTEKRAAPVPASKK